MNEQTRQLIERLAEKLGTTAEHLWSVLVRQAPISSASTAIALGIGAAVLVWSYRLVSRKTQQDGDWNDGCGSRAVLWIIWAGVATFWLMAVCCELSGMVAGFVNPEYWALKQLLNK